MEQRYTNQTELLEQCILWDQAGVEYIIYTDMDTGEFVLLMLKQVEEYIIMIPTDGDIVEYISEYDGVVLKGKCITGVLTSLKGIKFVHVNGFGNTVLLENILRVVKLESN